MSTPRETSDPLQFIVGGALALAAHFFPRPHADGVTRVRVDDAVFLLSGHMSLWSQWPHLDPGEQILVTQLLRLRTVEVANRTVFTRLVNAHLAGCLTGFVRTEVDGELIVNLGRPPRDYAAECVTVLASDRQMQQSPQPPVAGAGEFQAPLYRERGDRKFATDVTYRLADAEICDEEPAVLGAAAIADTLTVPVHELRALAERLDAANPEKTYRVDSVKRMFDNLQAAEGHEVGDIWTLRAGPTSILHAPTGVGKNVLAELLACWCVKNNRVATILVQNNASVVKTAYSITRQLSTLNLAGEVVPLTSPASAQRTAEVAILGDPSTGGPGEWAMEMMAYGCALPMSASAEAVDAWEPGSEPCSSLRKVNGEHSLSGRHVCPWKPGCGKFRNVRAATVAPVIVTTFDNWLAGVVHVPVEVAGRVEGSLSVEQLLMHRSDIVVIDEIDAFQARMISRSADGLLLAHRKPSETPLRKISSEMHRVQGRIDSGVEHSVRSATGLAMELAEGYTAHLAAGDFAPIRGTRKQRHPLLGRWMLPRQWDAYLASVLFDVPDEEKLSRGHIEALQSLFSEPTPDSPPLLDWLDGIRNQLVNLAVNRGEDPFAAARENIFRALGFSSSSRLRDPDTHGRVADALIRRAYFDRLRRLLLDFVYFAPSLQASGVPAARDIGSVLGQYKTWRAAPYGPLGRALFAFTQAHDPDRPDDTSLKVSAFGGDPHEYVRSLGDTTALAHTARRRIVLGMSATSYLPGAPHHHVFTSPTWWVSDGLTGGLEIQSSPVSGDDAEFIRVSGTQGQERTDTLVVLGERLWRKQLAPELRKLATDPDTVKRQRLLLATTSYAGARDLAIGISNAGVPAEDIVLAVKPDQPRDAVPSARWQELPADQLEAFGQTVHGKMLIAPLARAQRGINLADGDGKSLIGSVWLVVRPIPVIDEPSEILAHVHAAVTAATTPVLDPAGALALIRRDASLLYKQMFTTLPYYSALPTDVQLAITAEILVGLIQLAGRARRGNTTGRIHLVDYAFLDPAGESDLPHLIRELRERWRNEYPPGTLDLIQSLYGRTIDTVFQFADDRKPHADEQ